MPQLLKTLDEIARKKQRDVVCVSFFGGSGVTSTE
jgi:hypothetical protein